MVLLSVTIRDYVINIVTTHECVLLTIYIEHSIDYLPGGFSIIIFR